MMHYLGYWEKGGFYEDSPYVDDSLPIYYPLTETTDITARLGVSIEIILAEKSIHNASSSSSDNKIEKYLSSCTTAKVWGQGNVWFPRS